MTDAETSDVIAALMYRVKARDEAIRDGRDYPDAEPFALKFMTVLALARLEAHRGEGIRPAEASPGRRNAVAEAGDRGHARGPEG